MFVEVEYRVVEKSDSQGRLLERTWKSMRSNAAHRAGAPAVEKFDPVSGKLVSVSWIDQHQGGRHREDCLPAFIQIDPVTDVIYNEEYHLSGMQHRGDGGPTKILRNRNSGVVVAQEFHIDGRLQRGFDLPALMEFDAETGQVQRLEYYQDGFLHRNNRPAVIEFDEDGKTVECQYYLRGKEQTPGMRSPNLEC